MEAQNPNSITGYHAHIYYDDATRPDAYWVREEIRRQYSVVMGRWRDKQVGPHRMATGFQILRIWEDRVVLGRWLWFLIKGGGVKPE